MFRPRSSFDITCVIASTRGLGRGVDAVAGVKQSRLAGRHVDDASAIAQPLRGLAQGVEGALQVDRDMAVEQPVVALGDRGQMHDAGIVHQHIHAAERRIRRVEHAARPPRGR